MLDMTQTQYASRVMNALVADLDNPASRLICQQRSLCRQ
jgi:hypothetical protein